MYDHSLIKGPKNGSIETGFYIFTPLMKWVPEIIDHKEQKMNKLKIENHWSPKSMLRNQYSEMITLEKRKQAEISQAPCL